MNARGSFVRSNFCFAATALLVAVGMTPAFAQQGPAKGIVSDWSNHHVVFASPGSEMDALMSGKRQEYQSFVSNPRYQTQQIKRSAAWANRFAAAESSFSESHELGRVGESESPSIKRDWAVNMAPAGNGTALGMFPAEYANSFATASCADFVVFPVNAAGTATQPNIVGFDNLYDTTCNSGGPSVQFAYYLKTGSTSGTVQTSPVVSENGQQVAFVDSINGGSYFYVLTLAKTGTVAAPTQLTTTSGTGYTAIALDHAPSVTRSSPYVDYTHHVAYVGDDNGYLHKIQNVFNGSTPSEVTTGGWPVQPAGAVTTLTGPVLDSTSGNIFVGAGNGNIYCVVASTAKACTTASVDVSGGGTAVGDASGSVLDAPIVVSNGTSGWVFSEAVATTCTETFDGNCFATSTESVLTQVTISSTTGLGTVVRTTDMGDGGTDLRNGDFDNSYYNGTFSSGHMYFCGNQTASSRPTLYRVGFNSSGTMNTTNDGNSFELVTATGGGAGTGEDCTPLTEVFNGTTDYVFLGVKNHGFTTGTTNCGGTACIMGFDITSGFPTTAHATFTTNLGTDGTSGIVIDNVSTTKGASQIYFGNLENGDATQASQGGLQ